MMNSQLIIKDFDRQSILAPSEVGSLIKALPKGHIKGLQTIVYIPKSEFSQRSIPTPQGCKGAFFPEFYSVVIFDLVGKSTAAHILYHEIGHYVFHCVIDSCLKKEWVTRVRGSSEAVTTYARQNAIEEFAEAYALYATKNEILINKGSKYRFMKNRVFSPFV